MSDSKPIPSNRSVAKTPVVSDGGSLSETKNRTIIEDTKSRSGSQPAFKPDAVAVGTKLGPYELVRKLGQGGMGAVYEARHSKLNKTFALKVLPAGFASNEGAVTRFEREMQAIGQLDHPHIIKATDAGEWNGTHILVMEYVEGTDLSVLVKTRGPLSVRDACKAIRQAALGLQHAHEHGLVHRDIKPSNLFVTKSGQIKLLDLGLARLGDDGEQQRGLTSVGQILGTPDYMAPEQWDDTHSVDARADLYSLGCTLCFVLTGRAPYADVTKSSLLQLMKAHVEGAIPNLTDIRLDVPPELNAIFVRLLAKQAEARYPNAAAVIAALEPFTRKSADGSTLTSKSVFAPGKEPPTAHAAPSTSAGQPGRDSERSGQRSINSLSASSTDDAFTSDGPLIHGDSSASFAETIIQPRAANRVQRRWPLIIGLSGLGLTLLIGIIIQFMSDAPSVSASREASAPGHSADDEPVRGLTSTTDYALEFDGQDDYVELPFLKIPSGPMSVEAWITTPQDWMGTAVATRGDGQVMTLYVQENNVGSYFAIDKLDCYLLRPFQGPSHDRMIHVAGVWDGTSLFCFIDGSLFASQRASRQRVGDYLTTRSSIGADVNVIQGAVQLKSFFRGRIKELRISRSAKYQVPFTPAVHFESGEDTVALYHFDDGTGDVLSDSSGHDHHGKIVGAKWVNVDGSPITSPVPLVRTKSAVVRDSALAPGEIPEPLSLAGHTEGIPSVCINKAGTRIASSSSDKTVRVWDTTTGETVRVFSEHDQVVWRLAFSPEDDRIASPSSDGTVKVWDANTGHVHCTFSGHGKPAICAAFSPDGKNVASGGDDGMVRIWDATTGEEEFVLAGHAAPIIHITFSPVGKLLASGSWDGTVKIWNTETGKEERTLPGNSGAVFGVCFSPDGKRVASCGRDGNVKISDLDAKEPLLIFTKNSATVTCASYSPDGNWIASCGDDRAVRIWNTTTGKEAAVFQGLGCHRVCFSADGRKVVGGEGTIVKVWDVSALARLTRQTTPSKVP